MVYGMPTLIEINNLEDTVKLCKELSLDFIELNMNLPQYQVEKLQNIKYLKELAQKNDIFYTIHLDENLNISDFNSAVSRAYLDTVKNSIEIAIQLDIPILNMHMNHGVHFTLPDKKVELFERYNEEYMESFYVFRDMCEKFIGEEDITICIENTNGYKDYEKRAIKYLLESKAFGLTLDIGHCHACKDVDEEFVLSNETKLRHFHIHDCHEKKDHMTLGTGDIDLFDRLDLARKNNCRCVVETKTIEALRQSISWLQKNGLQE